METISIKVWITSKTETEDDMVINYSQVREPIDRRRKRPLLVNDDSFGQSFTYPLRVPKEDGEKVEVGNIYSLSLQLEPPF